MARAPKVAPGTAGSNYPVIKDKEAVEAATSYALNLAETKRLTAENKRLKGVILKAMAGAPKAAFGLKIVTATDVVAIDPVPNREITKSMVGQIIEGSSGRSGYTTIEVR